MCELLGPLDFDAFCAGYRFYGEWKATCDRNGGAPAVELSRRDERARASYAA